MHPTIDPARIAEEVGLPEELVIAFLDDLRDKNRRMEAAVTADDREQVERVVHQMAGVAGSYGFPMLTTEAKAMVRAIRADRSAPLPAENLARVRQQLQSILG